MKLNAKEISKYIIKSFKENKDSWIRPELSLDTEKENREIGVRLTTEFGVTFIKNTADEFYKRESLKTSFLFSKKVYWSYLRRIKRIPIPLILFMELINTLLIIPILYQMFKFYDHNNL